MIHPRNIVPGYSHQEPFSLFSLGTLVDEGVRQFVETGSSEVKRIHPEKIFTQTKYSSIRNIHPDKIRHFSIQVLDKSSSNRTFLDAILAPPIVQGVGNTSTNVFVDGNHSMVRG